MHEHLRWVRVPPEEMEDLAQDVLLRAWSALVEGGFRPSPHMEMAQALDAWLYGITWRALSHHRHKAYRRYEVSIARPEVYRDPPGGVEDPFSMLEARSALRYVAQMIGAGELDVELLFGDPEDPTDPEPADLVAIAMQREVSPRALGVRRDAERQEIRARLDHVGGSISCPEMTGDPNPLEWDLHASEPAKASKPTKHRGCGSRRRVLVDFSDSGVSCSPVTQASPSVDGSRASE